MKSFEQVRSELPRSLTFQALNTDVLIVGSGFGGASPAYRLSKAGMRVMILEAGPRFTTSDVRQTQDPQYFKRYLGSVGGKDLSLTIAKSFGGASPFYEMVSLRAPSRAFEQRDANGRRLWPETIDRRALDPFYNMAESMLAVRQLDFDRIPKTGQVFSQLMKDLGHTCERMPMAIGACAGSGYCVAGCAYGAKRELPKNYLRLAEELGAQVFSNMQAMEVKEIAKTGQRTEAKNLRDMPYRYRVQAVSVDVENTRAADRNAPAIQVEAKILILAAGTVGSAEILMRNKLGKNLTRTPTLRRVSLQVGKNIAFNQCVKAVVLLPDRYPDVDNFSGASIPGVISYAFAESHGFNLFPAKPLPLQLTASVRMRLEGITEFGAWGLENVKLMKKYRKRAMVLAALGFTRPSGRLLFDDCGELTTKLQNKKTLVNDYEKSKKILKSILVSNGAKWITLDFLNRDGRARKSMKFGSAHHVGSCRMADSSKRGVVNPAGEVYGYPDMYVTDGAVIPSSLSVNTSLTILANAERISEGLLGKYRL